MLKIIIPLTTLLLYSKNKFNWLHTMSLMMILSCLMTPMLYSSYNIFTPWSSMDVMAATLIMLSMWITSMMMMASMKIKLQNLNPKTFKATILTLLLILIMAFSSSSLLSFYLWFEVSLIPTMYLIMAWGYQPERLTASIYLLLYTVAASLPLLTSIMIMFNFYSSLSMPLITLFKFPVAFSSLPMWFMLLMAFMVKLPMFLTHLWLPKAHVEAPIAGSMILAAVLLKLGGYGLMRMMKMFTMFNKKYALLFLSVSLVGAVITGFICVRQSDMKSLIAYSSVGHMGLLIAGVMSYTKVGIQGSMAMMIAHGFSSSALFILANFTYEKFNTRSLFFTKGVLYLMPVLTTWWFMFIVSNMAAPPSSNLLSEILLIMGVSSTSLITMPLLMSVSFITAAYSWTLYSMLNHGKNSNNFHPLINMAVKDHLLLFMHMIPILIMLKPLTILG